MGCADGAWVATLDVIGLNKTSGSISITARHSSSDGRSAHRASKNVTNHFICPENFVGVPSLGDYTANSFCVAKYEMKNDGSGQAVSQAADVPYTGVSRDDAVVKCISMGSGYDLLTNDGWQSMARHIELVGDNWSGGNVGSSEGFSQGHSYESSNDVFNDFLAASSDDNKGCHGTEQTCDGRTWNKQRRTHTFSNGEVIWDVSGNAWEWVKDDNSDDNNGVYGDNAYMSQVTSTSHTTARSLSGGTTTTARVAKDQFGPSGDFSSLNSGHYGGLGYGYLNQNGGTVTSWGFLGVVENHAGESSKSLWPIPMTGALWPTLLGSVVSITLEARPQLFLLTSLKVLIAPMPQALESLAVAPKRAIRLKSVWEE